MFARARRTYPDLPQVTGGVVVLNRSMEALFVERKNDPAANTFAFPGGRLDLGETMEACARREVKEETNIDLDPSFPLQHVTTIEVRAISFFVPSLLAFTDIMFGGLSAYELRRGG